MRTAAAISRDHYSTELAPLCFQTTLKRADIQVLSSSPIFNTKGDIAYGNQMGRPAISSLLFRRRPSNVARLIVTIIIRKTVNRVNPRWFRAKYGKEISEGCKSKFDAAFAIVRELLVIRIIAPFLSVAIRGVFWCAGSAVRSQAGTYGFGFETSARLSVTTSQIVRRTLSQTATDAFTQPLLSIIRLSEIPQYIQASVYLVGQIHKSWIGWFGFKNNGRLIVDHFSSSLADLMGSMRSHIRSTSLIISNPRGAC